MVNCNCEQNHDYRCKNATPSDGIRAVIEEIDRKIVIAKTRRDSCLLEQEKRNWDFFNGEVSALEDLKSQLLLLL